MSEQNKMLIKRWFEEVWNQGSSEAIDELLDEGSRDPRSGWAGRQKDGRLQRIPSFINSFAALRYLSYGRRV